jgi:hypothetical protein
VLENGAEENIWTEEGWSERRFVTRILCEVWLEWFSQASWGWAVHVALVSHKGLFKVRTVLLWTKENFIHPNNCNATTGYNL